MEINFINKPKTKNNLEIKTKNGHQIIDINIKDVSNYDLDSLINNLKKFLDKNIKITFKNISNEDAEVIILKLNNITFSYTEPSKYNIPAYLTPLVKEVEDYKRITIEPNKYQDTMLQYFISKIPSNYTYKKFTVKKNDRLFPLTSAVGQGSSHKSYFIHIMPKKHNKSWDDIFMIGKCVTFDSGGMNLKTNHMHEMKTDMAGSAILMGTLNMTHQLPKNINLLIPIVENYIGSEATRPSTVVKTLNKHTVEINDTDAEGRLIIADAVEYFNKYLSKNLKNPLLLDVATLTGNSYYISSSVSCIIMGNEKSQKYLNDLFLCGERVKEFVDILVLRENYGKFLESEVADIKNYSEECKAGSLMGGAFIEYFVNKKIPWVHLDVASVVYNKDKVSSFGINLLTKFLQTI